MKKLTFTLSLIAALFTTNNVSAQACGNDGSSVCTPTGVQTPGFQDQNTIPCAERQVAYDQNIQFTMFSQFNFQGQQSVDSIKFNSIGNLPCGLCWSLNQADRTYTGNENGCIRITGTTNDPAGQYKLALNLIAWINGLSTGIPVSSSLASQAGISLYLRVKDNGSSNCANVDTSAGATNLTATTNCPVGIEDLNTAFTHLSITPNPVNSDAKLTFVAEKEAQFTMSVTDFRGAVVNRMELTSNTGVNEVMISRNNLSAGVYFISLSNGKQTVTKRFTVVD